MKHTFLPQAYLNGKFVAFDQANVSIATHALHYGTAAFGGMRGFVDEKNPNQTILFRLKDHAKRLSDSAKYLQADFSAEHIENAITELVKQNKPTKPFYIRPLVYISDLGIAPRVHDAEKDLLIYGLEAGDYLKAEGVSVCFSSWSRQPDSSVPLRGKISGAYITSSLAKSEAVARGFDEAILLRIDGKVAEASAMNLFIVRNGTIITPGVEQDILEGITRRSVLEIARELNIPVIERAVDKTELYIADEIFLCGTMARITAVNKVESTKITPNGPITKQLSEVLNKIVTGNSELECSKDWAVKINY
jgi:branched-chain amino acid aminotransferase